VFILENGAVANKYSVQVHVQCYTKYLMMLFIKYTTSIIHTLYGRLLPRKTYIGKSILSDSCRLCF
jgi:hypothetical protein